MMNRRTNVVGAVPPSPDFQAICFRRSCKSTVDFGLSINRQSRLFSNSFRKLRPKSICIIFIKRQTVIENN